MHVYVVLYVVSVKSNLIILLSLFLDHIRITFRCGMEIVVLEAIFETVSVRVFRTNILMV